MFSQAYASNAYGVDYQQQYYYQQQQQQKQQQMIAGVMSYYSQEAAAMFYNPYSSYAHLAQSAQLQPQQFTQSSSPVQQFDYQQTPALYLLNQQAELLQKSLTKTSVKKTTSEPVTGKPVQRKPRGPYRKRTNKTLSPTVSPAPEFDADRTTERLSTSDLVAGSSNNRTTDSIEAGSGVDSSKQQQQRKRKSDSSVVDAEYQQTLKQMRTLHHKQSIFRDVTMMAVSSCAQ